jgi:hypothetical protein
MGKACGEFSGERFENAGLPCVKAELDVHSAAALRRLFPFTAPSPVLGHDRTFGLGDRLGLATAGHIRAIGGYDAYPVLAQQSVRELTLTERTFGEVLDCVTFSVFREASSAASPSTATT